MLGENEKGAWLGLNPIPLLQELEDSLPGRLHIPRPNWCSHTPHPPVLLLLLDLLCVTHRLHQLLPALMLQVSLLLAENST